MKWADFYLRLKALVLRNQVERELDGELEFHIEMATRKKISEGESPAEARRLALLQFGGTSKIAEECRDQRRVGFAQDVFQDIRYACRQLRGSPPFTIVVLVSLTLAIAANTAVFSVLDGLMWRHLPVPRSDELVAVVNPSGPPELHSSFPYPLFEELHQRVNAISGLSAVYQRTRLVNGSQAQVSLVSGEYFQMLGVPAELGRTLSEEDYRGGIESQVAVISDSYWTRAFQRSGDIVGKKLTINLADYRIVGVAGSGFSGDEAGIRVDLWLPITEETDAAISQPSAVRIVGRLDGTGTVSEAETQLNHALERGRQDLPQNGMTPAGYLHLESYASGYSGLRGVFRVPLATLFALVAILLLVACANVANLFLARAVMREKEMALRLSLGASRTRILRQVITESLLLATIAGALSLVCAQWLTQGFLTLMHEGLFAIDLDAGFNYRVLAFSATLAAMAGLLFGGLPAIVSSNIAPFSSMKRTTHGSETKLLTFGRSMVISQVCLCVLLLIAAGLFVQTFRNLKLQDWGFDRQHVSIVRTAADEIGLEDEALAELFQASQRAVESIPGVVSASTSSLALLTGQYQRSPLTVEGYLRRPSDPVLVSWNLVGPRYFETVGIRFLAGRDFTEGDRDGSAAVAIINEAMALRFFGDSNPIGKRFGLRHQRGNEIEIVGVVRNAKYSVPREDSESMVYLPYRQDTGHLRSMSIAIRTSKDDPRLNTHVSEQLSRLNPRVPIISIESMDDHVDSALALEYVIAALSAFFGVVALLLACVGLYGTMSFKIARRRQEIGIRLALGATPRQVLCQILGESSKLVVIGILAGVPISFFVTRIFSDQLFGVRATNVLTLAGAVLLILTTATVGGWLPARRAARMEPVATLRND